MTDITTIPTEELEKDLADSRRDIIACEAGLICGVTTYGNNESVQERLEANRYFVEVITAELNRRAKEVE